jgi:hypothetical protein
MIFFARGIARGRCDDGAQERAIRPPAFAGSTPGPIGRHPARHVKNLRKAEKLASLFACIRQ